MKNANETASVNQSSERKHDWYNLVAVNEQTLNDINVAVNEQTDIKRSAATRTRVLNSTTSALKLLNQYNSISSTIL
jgi:hypothetical protein